MSVSPPPFRSMSSEASSSSAADEPTADEAGTEEAQPTVASACRLMQALVEVSARSGWDFTIRSSGGRVGLWLFERSSSSLDREDKAASKEEERRKKARAKSKRNRANKRRRKKRVEEAKEAVPETEAASKAVKKVDAQHVAPFETSKAIPAPRAEAPKVGTSASHIRVVERDIRTPEAEPRPREAAAAATPQVDGSAEGGGWRDSRIRRIPHRKLPVDHKGRNTNPSYTVGTHHGWKLDPTVEQPWTDGSGKIVPPPSSQYWR